MRRRGRGWKVLQGSRAPHATHPIAWILVLAGGTFLLAIVGYSQYLPASASWSDRAFLALNLLVLNFHAVPGRSTPLALDVARFAAHAVAGTALILAVLGLARSRVSRFRSARLRDHVVILGSSTAAVELALAYQRRGRVTLVGAAEEDDLLRLRRAGVLVTGAVDDVALAGIVDRSARVIIAGSTEPETVRETTRLMATGTVGDATVHLLVDDPDLASELQSTFKPLIDGRLDVCCGASRLATAVLRRFPPRDEQTVCPPPVVIGDGATATELVRQLAYGWHRPAEPMEVLLLGPDPAHADEVADRIGSWARLHTLHEPWSPRAAVRAVARHAELRRPEADARQRRTEEGPLVLLAGLDDATTFLLAAKIVRSVGGARVVAVVEHPEGWEAIEHGDAAPDATVQVLAARSLLADPGVIESDLTWTLAEEILADEQRWPADLPGAFGVEASPEQELNELPAPDREALLRIAGAIPVVLNDVGLVPMDRSEQLVLLPEELVRIAEGLAEAMEPRLPTDDYRLLVAAANLPELAARVGLVLGRVRRPEVLLTDADVETMAMHAHLLYVRQQADLGNATGSGLVARAWHELTPFGQESNRAQVRDIPVKLAGAGRCLVAATDVDQPETSWLTADVVERLAGWEHRRWVYLHRRAGYSFGTRTDHRRREHELLRPYGELTEDQRELDRNVVRSIPELLAAAGFGTRPLDRSDAPRPGYHDTGSLKME